jgi:hypothetical protein
MLDAAADIESLAVLRAAVLPIARFPLNGAIRTSPVSATSIDGIPETSFTEKSVPVSELVIENNCPADPSKLITPESVRR